MGSARAGLSSLAWGIMSCVRGLAWERNVARVVGAFGLAMFALACDGSASEGSSDDAAMSAPDASADATAAHDAGPPPEAAVAPDSSVASGPTVTYGERYEGGEFHLGPVDWDETAFHNACAAGTKYPANVRRAEGALLAGIWNGISDPARYCDACIFVETARGKSALLRVVTYGDSSRNSVDVSPDAYALLNSGEYPRTMSFRFAKCADSGKLLYEFKSGSHEDWTAFWVRNARVPLRSVEVMGTKHGYSVCRREGDGSLVDDRGFGKGTFAIRVTAIDGQVRTDSFAWPAAGIASQLLEGAANFD
jgi:expansin (peptidoglycan-binding protein)